MMASRNFLISIFSITALVLIAFAVLKQLNIPAGTLVDWVIGISAFWWLMIIVTVPWNMHFAARAVIIEAQTSKEKGIIINEKDVDYAKKLSTRFLYLAIALHIISAVALYLLAYYQITSIGYMASIASLLLTFIRPLFRLYEHISFRLNLLSHQMKYPREDVNQLKGKIFEMENTVNYLTQFLNISDLESWASKQVLQIQNLQNDIKNLHGNIAIMDRENKIEHEVLSRKSESEIAKLSEDAQFLTQVREIIRFFKKA